MKEEEKEREKKEKEKKKRVKGRKDVGHLFAKLF